MRECLASLRAQTYTDWCAVVVDDASTIGNPLDVVRATNDPRISLVRHNQNRGQGAARNTGFRMAKTEWALPLDGDDKLDSRFLEAVCEACNIKPTTDCIYTDLYEFGLRERVLSLELKQPHDMLMEQWITGAGAAMKCSLWERIGGYAEDKILMGNEDWDFWLGAVGVGFEAIRVPEPLYLYRRHSQAVSPRLPFVAYAQRELMYKRHKALFDRHGQGRKFRADGYAQSATAYYYSGDRKRAAKLAWRGWLLMPQRTDLAYLGVRALIPDTWIKPLKNLMGRRA